MRVVQRGSHRTITGREVCLSEDGAFSSAAMRLVLLDLTLGRPASDYRTRAKSDSATAEALRRWNAGCRAVNSRWFTTNGPADNPMITFAATGLPADGASVLAFLESLSDRWATSSSGCVLSRSPADTSVCGAPWPAQHCCAS